LAILIENRWPALLTVELNSGQSLHLAPGEASGPIEDYETEGNARVSSLADRGLISVSRQAVTRPSSRRTTRTATRRGRSTKSAGRTRRGAGAPRASPPAEATEG
jgi:hypothetical protein